MRAWGAVALLMVGMPGLAAAQGGSIAEAQRTLAAADREIAAADRALGRWTATELTPFASETDFAAYQAALLRRDAARSARSGALWTIERQARPPEPAQEPIQVITAEEIEAALEGINCAEGDKACLSRRFCSANPDCSQEFWGQLQPREDVATIVNRHQWPIDPNATNSQNAGEDSAATVKQIGRHLLVLLDGRVFVIDTEGGETRDGLVLTDRANAYRHPSDTTWYGALNVHGGRVVVTGYSRQHAASEIAVFRLSPEGRLSRDGVFQIRTNGYHRHDSWPSWIIDGKLVFHTQMFLSMEAQNNRWPTLRRVPITGASERPESEAAVRAAFDEGEMILPAARVYRPLVSDPEPVLHVFTICTLGDRTAADLACESKGFVGKRTLEPYVAGGHAYLWDADTPYSRRDDDDPPACRPGYRPPRAETEPAIVYRIGLTSDDDGVAGANGVPFNALGVDAGDRRFRALLSWRSTRCDPQKGFPIAYFDIPQSAFTRRLRPVPDSAFTAMPDIAAGAVENRFIGRFLVFGGRAEYGQWNQEAPKIGPIGGGAVVAVPIDQPRDAVTLWAPHRVWRVDRVGDHAILTGYADASGLTVSVLNLGGPLPRLASSVLLEGRFEGERDSHIFDSRFGEDGIGLVGLPTLAPFAVSGRQASLRAVPDLSFLSVDADGDVRSLGVIRGRAEATQTERASTDPGVYTCQVSCLDIRIHAQALFVGRRVFALTLTDLVEGQVRDGRIAEVQRLDLTRPVGTHSPR